MAPFPSSACVSQALLHPYPGSQPGTMAKQKVPFLGRPDVSLTPSLWLSLGSKGGFRYIHDGSYSLEKEKETPQEGIQESLGRELHWESACQHTNLRI